MLFKDLLPVCSWKKQENAKEDMVGEKKTDAALLSLWLLQTTKEGPLLQENDAAEEKLLLKIGAAHGGGELMLQRKEGAWRKHKIAALLMESVANGFLSWYG